MSDHSATWYGAKRLVFAQATAIPMSRTSGALLVPASDFTALTSSWLLPWGFAWLTLIPYFASKSLMMLP